MFKRYQILLAALAASVSVQAQTPDWSTSIAPILYNNCVSCHRTGGIAPFELVSYQNAVTYGSAISSAVQARRMPPWPPDPTYKRLAHERLLKQDEIDKIVNWVNGGKPQGDPTLAPPPPVFNSTGDLPGTPDLVAQIPHYTSTAMNGDVYRCFVVPSGFSVDKYISAFEAIPGNRSIVHHVLVYADTTGACASLDAADPGPGYTSFGGVGTNAAILLGGWVPGTSPLKYPAGFGVRLPKNADIIIQIHYPSGSQGMQDSTKINFFFSTASNVRSVFIDPALNHDVALQNGPLFIPANQTKTFTAKFDVPNFLNASVLGVAPHMHMIGRSISCFGITPSNDTQKFIRINDWNFHWQGFYMFPRIQKVVGGTKLYANAFYDNTANNIWNPSNPPQNVSLGEATTDEMLLVYFIYSLYQPGDENIVIDSNAITSVPATYYRGQQLLEVYPNPASQQLTVKTYLEEASNGSIDLISLDGRLIQSLVSPQKLSAGYHAKIFNIESLPPGVYQLRFRTSERIITQKVVVR